MGFESRLKPFCFFSLHGCIERHCIDVHILCLHVLDSYVELRDDRRPVFAFFFAAWPELKARVLTSPGVGTSGIAATGGI